MSFSQGAVDLLEYHSFLLSDEGRLGGFRQAIQSEIQPGSVVLDLGSGTGILSFFACQAGARRVYAIEADGSCELGKSLCKHNGFSDRVRFIRDYSNQVTLPERADAIVAMVEIEIPGGTLVQARDAFAHGFDQACSAGPVDSAESEYGSGETAFEDDLFAFAHYSTGEMSGLGGRIFVDPLAAVLRVHGCTRYEDEAR